MTGFFLSVEGGEGSGKSSAVKKIADSLRADGYDVVQTREPGGGPSAEKVRHLVLSGDPDQFCGMSELLLFAAARVEHLRQVIRPALDRGAVVVCDRYIGSTLAYQSFGRGVPRDLIEQLHEMTVANLMPDKTILLDVPAEIGVKRSLKRLADAESSESRFESLDLDFHKRVEAGFKTLAKEQGWTVLDATQQIGEVQKYAYHSAKLAIEIQMGKRRSVNPEPGMSL